MKSISEILGLKRPSDGIPPSASPAPFKPRGQYAVDDWTPLLLAPEGPNLLREYAGTGMPQRPQSCRILGASRLEHERQKRTALAAALAFEAAVAENELILHPDDAAAAARLDLFRAALPVVDDRRALPLAVTR